MFKGRTYVDVFRFSSENIVVLIIIISEEAAFFGSLFALRVPKIW